MEILRRAALCLAALLSCALCLHAAPAGPGALEYKVKAVFLLNFTQFVKWPDSSFPDAGSPMVIGILGTDPFGDFIDQVVKGEQANNRPITVRRFSDAAGASACNVLYVSRSETDRIRSVLANLKGSAVLTVSDVDNFTRLGGMIRFYEDDNRIRLRINNEAALSQGLVISSKLLRPSQIVTSAEN